MSKSIISAVSSTVDKSSSMIASVGSSLQKKMDESGVSSKITSVVHGAAEKGMSLGSQLYSNSSEKFA